MYSTNIEEAKGGNLKSSIVSERIKEAIVEMNIMKQKRVSRDDLVRIIEDLNDSKVI